MAKNESPNLLRAKQVAKELGIHVYTAYELMKSGRLKAFKIRTHWRVKKEDLDTFMEGGKSD